MTFDPKNCKFATGEHRNVNENLIHISVIHKHTVIHAFLIDLRQSGNDRQPVNKEIRRVRESESSIAVACLYFLTAYNS